MFNRKSMVIAAVAAVLALTSVAPGSAFSPLTVANNLTFSRAVALPGVVLPAGSYVFQIAPPGTHVDIVRVMTPRGRTLYMGFTRAVRRPSDLPADRLVTFGETPAGEPTPISAWYPIGSSEGHEFVYE